MIAFNFNLRLEPLSEFAFNFNLRLFITGYIATMEHTWLCWAAETLCRLCFLVTIGGWLRMEAGTYILSIPEHRHCTLYVRLYGPSDYVPAPALSKVVDPNHPKVHMITGVNMLSRLLGRAHPRLCNTFSDAYTMQARGRVYDPGGRCRRSSGCARHRGY